MVKKNYKYQKGARLERKYVNKARAENKIAFRSAGSHSPIDVVVIDIKLKKIRFIQCKAKKLSQKTLKSLRDQFKMWSDEYQVEFELLGNLPRKINTFKVKAGRGLE